MRKVLVLFFLIASTGRAEPQWRPVNGKDYVLLGSLAAATWGVSRVETEDHPGFRGFFIDNPVRTGIGQSSRPQRKSYATVSDGAVGLAISLPLVQSVFFNSKNFSSGYRMAITSLEAFALSGLMITSAKHLVRRPRPYNHGCKDNSEFEEDCGKEDSQRSFFSGHSGMSFTAAGLVCRFNQELPSGLNGLCGSSIALAASVATLRMMADKHYFSDVLIGGLVGWSSGYYFPGFIHSPNTFLTYQPIEGGHLMTVTSTY